MFPHLPNQTVLSMPSYLLPNSFYRRPAFSIRPGKGGWAGVVTIPPLGTSVSAVIYISPTRMTTLPATESCAVPVVLSLRFSSTVYPAPFPVSPVGYPISATIKLTLP